MSHTTTATGSSAPNVPTPGAAVSLRSLLEEMIERDASDLHITAGERAKLRVDGDIVITARVRRREATKWKHIAYPLAIEWDHGSTTAAESDVAEPA